MVDKNEKPVKNNSISTGSVVVTHEKLQATEISSGAVVVASDSVVVHGNISSGSIVMCLGPVKAHRISSGASVISNQNIIADSVGVSSNLVSAPQVDIRDDNWKESKRVSFIQAITDPKVKGELERKFDVDIDEYLNNGIKSLPDLVEMDV